MWDDSASEVMSDCYGDIQVQREGWAGLENLEMAEGRTQNLWLPDLRFGMEQGGG